jgi:hypothetical protein
MLVAALVALVSQGKETAERLGGERLVAHLLAVVVVVLAALQSPCRQLSLQTEALV